MWVVICFSGMVRCGVKGPFPSFAAAQRFTNWWFVQEEGNWSEMHWMVPPEM